MDHRSPTLPLGLKRKSRPALPPSHIPLPFLYCYTTDTFME